MSWFETRKNKKDRGCISHQWYFLTRLVSWGIWAHSDGRFLYITIQNVQMIFFTHDSMHLNKASCACSCKAAPKHNASTIFDNGVEEPSQQTPLNVQKVQSSLSFQYPSATSLRVP